MYDTDADSGESIYSWGRKLLRNVHEMLIRIVRSGVGELECLL